MPPPHGFSSVIDAIAAPALAAERILRLGKEVVRIDGSDGSNIAVTCRDGSVFHAPIVVVTVSLGVLKHWIAVDTAADRNFALEEGNSGAARSGAAALPAIAGSQASATPA